MGKLSRFTRHSFGVRNRGPWRSILSHSLHQFHENDLFTSAAAMSYFGLMALFPALLLLLAISNQFSAANELLTRAVDVYPGSSKFLRDTIRSLSSVGPGVIITCVIVVLWAGSWVFAVIERALNRIWGASLANLLAWTRAHRGNDRNRRRLAIDLGFDYFSRRCTARNRRKIVGAPVGPLSNHAFCRAARSGK